MVLDLGRVQGLGLGLQASKKAQSGALTDCSPSRNGRHKVSGSCWGVMLRGAACNDPYTNPM